jgi:hypothetical protein
VRFTSLDPTIWPVTAHPVNSLPIVPYPGASGATFPILTMPPNAVNSLDYDYERIWSVVDNATSIPVYTDKAARQFTSQKYEFFLVGGRRTPGLQGPALYAERTLHAGMGADVQR